MSRIILLIVVSFSFFSCKNEEVYSVEITEDIVNWSSEKNIVENSHLAGIVTINNIETCVASNCSWSISDEERNVTVFSIDVTWNNVCFGNSEGANKLYTTYPGTLEDILIGDEYIVAARGENNFIACRGDEPAIVYSPATGSSNRIDDDVRMAKLNEGRYVIHWRKTDISYEYTLADFLNNCNEAVSKMEALNNYPPFISDGLNCSE